MTTQRTMLQGHKVKNVCLLRCRIFVFIRFSQHVLITIVFVCIYTYGTPFHVLQLHVLPFIQHITTIVCLYVYSMYEYVYMYMYNFYIHLQYMSDTYSCLLLFIHVLFAIVHIYRIPYTYYVCVILCIYIYMYRFFKVYSLKSAQRQSFSLDFEYAKRL